MSGGFYLRKCSSNNQNVLYIIDLENKETKFPVQFEDKNAIKTLGTQSNLGLRKN